jgi:hypothetical protein
MEWWEMQDELEAKGYRIVQGRLHYPDGLAGGEYPRHWTAEQIVREAYAHIQLLERECPHLSKQQK